jgi:hypothetical protein
MKAYLAMSDVIDGDHPIVYAKAHELAHGCHDNVGITQKCFHFVRDEIFHSGDHGRDPVTVSASDTLIHRTGFCFAKSHLLSALLRALAIPAGICYQRIRLSDPERGPFTLHALNAVYLSGYGWYRIDARGNKQDVDARCEPPHEYLAYNADMEGELNIPVVFDQPLPIVIDVLRKYSHYRDILKNLPDLDIL